VFTGDGNTLSVSGSYTITVTLQPITCSITGVEGTGTWHTTGITCKELENSEKEPSAARDISVAVAGGSGSVTTTGN
jgi:hypothetical protein